MKLTSEQIEAIRISKDYLSGKIDKPYITISGAGGTGKTTVTKYIINELGIKNEDVLGIAISHSAVNQLFQNLDTRCVTLAKALNKKPVINKITGVKEFKTISNIFEFPMIINFNVLIIDECSMISDEDINDILTHRKQGGYIIMLGDICQHKPIGQSNDFSTTFDHKIIDLNQIMRFKEPLDYINQKYRNKILDYINHNKPVDDDFSFEERTGEFGSINKLKSRDHLISTYVSLMKHSSHFDNRIIAYENDTINEYNDAIRKLIFGANSPQIVVGDILLSNDNYGEGAINNNSYFEIVSIQNAEQDGLKCFNCVVKNKNNFMVSGVLILNQIDKFTYFNRLKELKQAKQFAKYYKLRETFINYSYGYAVTSYKAQGSTIKNVFVDLHEIKNVEPISNLEKMETAYVAVSRASNNIYIYE